jgi:hypothetical protein
MAGQVFSFCRDRRTAQQGTQHSRDCRGRAGVAGEQTDKSLYTTPSLLDNWRGFARLCATCNTHSQYNTIDALLGGKWRCCARRWRRWRLDLEYASVVWSSRRHNHARPPRSSRCAIATNRMVEPHMRVACATYSHNVVTTQYCE